MQLSFNYGALICIVKKRDFSIFHRRISILLFFLIFFSIKNLDAQGDDPCGATLLQVSNGSCSYISGTNVGLSASSGVPDPGCASSTGAADAWYKVVVPVSGHLQISSSEGILTDGGMAIYSGTCVSLTLIECNDDSGPGYMPMIDRAGLIADDTLWVRFWGYGGAEGSFSICVLNVIPPANEEPCNAISLTVSSGTCSPINASNIGATASTGVPAPGCSGSVFNDVWYKSVVPTSGRILFSTEEGTLTDGGMAIYSGTCSTLTLLECDDDDGSGSMPMIDRSGLTPGNTIWIRVWGYSGATGTFEICAFDPIPPVNDDPCNATDLPVSSGACIPIAGTNYMASGSVGVPASGCANYLSGDVWYKTVVPASGRVLFSTEAGTLTDGGMAIYSGAACGSLTLIECDDEDGTGSMPMIDRTGLTPGSTVWIRVWGYAGAAGTFEICAIELVPPANDDPCNATNLTLSSGTCIETSGINMAATASVVVPAPNCANYNGADIWYKITVPLSGNVKFTVDDGSLSSLGMAIYSGSSCSSLTQIECNYEGGVDWNPMIESSGLTPGSTVWIRVWGYGGATGTFTICALTIPSIPSCATNTPASDELYNPTFICNLNGFCGNTSDSYTEDIPGDLDVVFCGSIENNSWLTFTANDDTAVINVWVSNCVEGDGIQMQIFEVIGNNFISHSNCWSPGSAENGAIVATNLLIGQTYYLMIDGFAGDVCDYITAASSGVLTGAEASTTDSIINCGESTTLNGSGGISYSWSSNPVGFTSTEQNPIVSPTITTTYLLEVLGGNPACPASNTDTVVVYVIPLVSNAGIDTSICSGEQINLSGTGGGIYSWTSNPVGFTSSIHNPTVSPTTTTTYTLLVQSASCSATDSVVISVTTSPVADAGLQQFICEGNSANLTAVGGTDYLWSTGETMANISVMPTITSTYTITVSNGNCSSTDEVEITVASLPQIQVTASPSEICVGASITLNSSSGESYNWASNPSGFTSTIQSPNSSPTITTQYVVTVSNASGCTDSETVEVTVNNYPLTSAFADQGTICKGTSNLLHSGGGTSYSWKSNPSGFLSGEQNPVVSPSINTTYIVTVDNGTGCVSTSQVIVNVDNMPQLLLFPSNAFELCAGSDTILSVTGANSYHWNTGAVDSSITISPITNTTYSVTATNGSCSVDTNFYINTRVIPYVELGPNIKGCEGDIISLFAQSNVSELFWSNGTSLNSIDVSTSGIYHVSASNSCGFAKDSVQVDFYPLPRINIGKDTTFCVTNFELLVPNSFMQYYWSTGEETYNKIATVGGIYTIEVVDSSGCEATDTIVLTDSCFTDIFIPNSFTPNEDGINEIFKVEALKLLEFEIFIYNRWGQQLYHSVDINMGWDGKCNNRINPQGTYYYFIVYRGIRDVKQSISGFVNLLR